MSILKFTLNPFKKAAIGLTPAQQQYYKMIGQQLEQYGRVFAPIRSFYQQQLQAQRGYLEQRPIGEATAAARAQGAQGLEQTSEGLGSQIESGHGLGTMNQYAAEAAQKAGVMGAQGAVAGKAAYIGGLQNVLQSALAQENMALRAQGGAAGIAQAFQQGGVQSGLAQAQGIGQAGGLLASLAGSYFGGAGGGAAASAPASTAGVG
ncbi:MAG: hypothetical protein IRZ03_16725 [Acidobacterium ailaaui]|nr:hypothetical protein [Pseudacidobacterium ailaaui]